MLCQLFPIVEQSGKLVDENIIKNTKLSYWHLILDFQNVYEYTFQVTPDQLKTFVFAFGKSMRKVNGSFFRKFFNFL